MTAKMTDINLINEVIELAWCDKTSFNHIHHLTGLTEAEVKKIMKKYLKPNSYRLWRIRVQGRTSKHDKNKNKQQES
jgi:uncharacterized protein (TIGR03643 family)